MFQRLIGVGDVRTAQAYGTIKLHRCTERREGEHSVDFEHLAAYRR